MRVSSAASPPCWKANIAITKPGVQKPHCVASASISACCTGCSAPSAAARPSTVSTRAAVELRQQHQAGIDRLVVAACRRLRARPRWCRRRNRPRRSLPWCRSAARRSRSQSSTVVVGGTPASGARHSVQQEPDFGHGYARVIRMAPCTDCATGGECGTDQPITHHPTTPPRMRWRSPACSCRPSRRRRSRSPSAPAWPGAGTARRLPRRAR